MKYLPTFNAEFKSSFVYAFRRMLRGLGIVAVILVIVVGLVLGVTAFIWLLTHGYWWIVIIMVVAALSWALGKEPYT